MLSNRLNNNMNPLSIECHPPHAIATLVEGNSIRSVKRMTETHRDTVMRLMVEVGAGCQQLVDQKMRNFSCKHIRMQVDDVRRAGDLWTWVVLDPETKLVPSTV